jgi:CRISPR-associated endonuclease/helicase Cas3
LMEHLSNSKHRRKHLFEHRPATMNLLYGLEQDLRRLTSIPKCKEQVEHWLRLFRAQAFDLRSIEPKVRVINERGQAFEYGRVWLQRETTVHQRGIETEDGILIQGNLDDYWREDKDTQAKRTWVCHFPHTAAVRTLPMEPGLVSKWCAALEDIDPYGLDWDDEPEALAAAKKLVQLTGLVPGHDPDIPLEAVSCVL